MDEQMDGRKKGNISYGHGKCLKGDTNLILLPLVNGMGCREENGRLICYLLLGQVIKM